MRCPSSVRSRRYSCESASAAARTSGVARLPPAVFGPDFRPVRGPAGLRFVRPPLPEAGFPDMPRLDSPDSARGVSASFSLRPDALLEDVERFPRFLEEESDITGLRVVSSRGGSGRGGAVYETEGWTGNPGTRSDRAESIADPAPCRRRSIH